MACYLFAVILLQTFAVSEGLQWITETSQITKCVGQSAHIMWKYVKEHNEVIRQQLWYFSNSVLIATSSANSSGLELEPSYQKRVEKYGETGILLKNVSASDTGNYTLYPRVAWEKNPSIFSIFLNVTDWHPENSCTCERMPATLQGNIKSTFIIKIDGCNLQINSSSCCPIGSALECYEGDPHELCITIPNQEKQTTGTGTVGIATVSIVTDPTDIDNSALYHLLQPLRDIIIAVLMVCILQLVIVSGTCVWFVVSKKCRIIVTTLSREELLTSTQEIVQQGPRGAEECTSLLSHRQKDRSVPQPVQVTSHWVSPNSTSYLLTWDKPDDGGSLLRKYVLRYQEVEIIPNRTEYELSRPLSEFISIDISPSTVSYRLTSLMPGRYYQVEIQAINTEGRSYPQRFIFKTKENAAMYRENLPTSALETEPLRARDTEENIILMTKQPDVETFPIIMVHGESESSF